MLQRSFDADLPDGKIFQRYRSQQARTPTLEANIFLHDVIVRLTLHSFDNAVDDDIDRLRVFTTRLERLSSTGLPPDAPGFCAGAVFVRGDEPVEEVADFYYSFTAPHDDVTVSFKTHSARREKKGLLDRALQQATAYATLGFKYTNLRSGSRKVNGLDGEELLSKAPLNDQGGVGQSLTWEVTPTMPSITQPAMVFEVETGNNANSQTTLSDAVVVGVYDHLLDTLRLRPVKK
jgi:hypothetical protein